MNAWYVLNIQYMLALAIITQASDIGQDSEQAAWLQLLYFCCLELRPIFFKKEKIRKAMKVICVNEVQSL